MSHDTHFLTRMERLKPGQTDWAMSLYRNVPLVKAIVRTMAPTHERVAIAVDDTAEPAHVLVESSGAFVTCLGSGMRHDLPVITRSAVEQAAKDRSRLGELLKQERTHASRAGFVELFKRLDDCRFLSRQTAVEMRAWAPAVGDILNEDFAQTFKGLLAARRVLNTPETLKPRHDGHVRKHWRNAWRLGHLSGLGAVGLRGAYRADPESIGLRTYFADLCWSSRLMGPALRGSWVVADMAYETLDDQESAYLRDGDPWTAYPAAYTLVMSALRVPALRPRIEAIVAKDFDIGQALDDEDQANLAAVRDVLADPKAALMRHLTSARSWADKQLPGMALDDKQVLAASLYAPHMLLKPEAYVEIADTLPFVAASSYEDLYLPDEVLATWPSPEEDAEARAYTEAVREQYARERPPPPPPRAPGRNEPCPCDSGRKFKKCHGAA